MTYGERENWSMDEYVEAALGCYDNGEMKQGVEIATEGLERFLPELLPPTSWETEDFDVMTEEIYLGYTVVDLYLQRCVAYDALRDYDAAIADLTAIIRLMQDYPRTFHRDHNRLAGWIEYRGMLHLKKGAHREAFADLDEAIRRKPTVPDWYLARSRVRYKLGDKSGAIADIHRGMEVDKGSRFTEEAHTLLEMIENDTW
jgi:tetratricopeptide (TPR) repeat protein